MFKILFTNDNNVELTFPTIFLDENGDPYRWYECYKHNIQNTEQKLRLLVSDMINNGILDTSKNFLDTGAFIGDNSLPWAKNIKGTLYAIDPSSNNKKVINNIAQLNDIKNITYIQEVLSDTSKIVSYNGDLDFNCFAFEGDKYISTTSIDILYKNGILKDIVLLHLDVEGLEFEVINGAIYLIKDLKPVILFEQHILNDRYILDIIKIFKDIDYLIYIIDEKAGANIDCRNFIAIPQHFHLDFVNKCSHMNFLIPVELLDQEQKKIK
jgi:FkbM family methyltransferase